MGLPALLGARDDLQAGERGRASRGAALAGALHVPELCSRPLETKIGIWYVNSLVTSAAVTVLVIVTATGAGYAISQLKFPGRRLFWWIILASFMVPIPALTVNHFVLINQFGPHQHAARRRLAAADRAGHGHYLQAVFRFGAEGFSRGRDDRRRERIPASVPHLLADELGQSPPPWRSSPSSPPGIFSLAIRGGTRGQNEHHGRDHGQVHDTFGVHYARDLAVAMVAACPSRWSISFFSAG